MWIRLGLEREQRKKGKKAEKKKEAMNAFERRPEFTWFFIYFFYLLAVYLARALSQQKETKNSSDGKSHQLLLICITVWCKRRKKRVALI